MLMLEQLMLCLVLLEMLERVEYLGALASLCTVVSFPKYRS